MAPQPLDSTRRAPIDLRADGVLWAINRQVFHPRGFALALEPDGSFVMLGDGTETIRFGDKADDLSFAALNDCLQRVADHNTPGLP